MLSLKAAHDDDDDDKEDKENKQQKQGQGLRPSPSRRKAVLLPWLPVTM